MEEFFHDTVSSDHPPLHNDTLVILKKAIQEGLLPLSLERAEVNGPQPKLYYGALNVAVLTLGLLLFVEAIRRRLDVSATGKRFYQAVLDGVYRELATLGVVELFIHLLQEYSSQIDTNKKALFADVHFLLFYTAIFNALQSAILAILAKRVSHHTWVSTEELELNHYVEIREEFDRVREEMFGSRARDMGQGTASSVTEEDRQSSNNLHFLVGSFRNIRSNLYDSESCFDVLRRACVQLFYTIRYPHLKAKYNRLLVQVRFHEMRVHFLQAYDLPLKLKVSKYLIRSEQNVLKHLVHVSTSAWLWLTALINVLYFITGMVADATGDSSSTEITLSACFFTALVLFLIVSLLLWRRMNSIFMKIMEMKHLWNFVDEDDAAGNNHDGTTTAGSHKSRSKHFQDPTLATEQKNLFFLGDPQNVVNAIQFMNFGYAMSLSVCVVFWEDMNSDGSHVTAKKYFLTTLVCYGFFVVVVARILPKYTMCTSLGQLVDRTRLHETVAMYRLEEAERQRRHMAENIKLSAVNFPCQSPQQEQQQQEQQEESRVDEESLKTMVASATTSAPHQLSTGSTAKPSKHDMLLPDFQKERIGVHVPKQKLPPKSDPPILSAFPTPTRASVSFVAPQDTLDPTRIKQAGAPALPVIAEKEAIEPDKASLLVDLVKMDTSSLRQAVPLEYIRIAESRDRRRNRRKSVSDGVASMSQFGNIGKLGQKVFETPRKPADPLDKLSKMPAEAEQQQLNNRKFSMDDSALLKRQERRRNRKKTMSASAAVQHMREMNEAEDSQGKSSAAVRKADLWKTDSVKEMPSSEGNLGVFKAPFFRHKPKNIFASSDDSATVALAAKQQRERRRHKKSLSASAAVRLMRDYPDEEENKLSKEAFWASSATHGCMLGGDGDNHDEHHKDEISNTQLQQQPLQGKSYDPFFSPAEAGLNLSPVKEASGHFEDASSHLDSAQTAPTLHSHTTGVISNANGLPAGESGTTSQSHSEKDDLDSYDGDDETVDTAGSVGGLSDVDDIAYSHRTSFYEDEETERGCSLCNCFRRANDSMRLFFRSQKYSFVTHMLGTMICFFLIGMRVEGFLKLQCIIPLDDYSWELELGHSFWMIVGWIVAFVCGSIWIALLFAPFIDRYQEDGEDSNIECKQEQWTMFLAAIYDLFICGACLGVFLGAEIHRCCRGDDEHYYDNLNPTEHNEALRDTGDPFHRFLAEVVGDYDEEECFDKTLVCVCPVFGTRLKGAVGPIEPFTSLIALRTFRFILARRTVQYFGLGSEYDELKRQEAKSELENGPGKRHTSERKSHQGAATTTHGGHDSHDNHGEMARGTIVELWQRAIAQCPEIVDKYGEFSGELLQTMLGLEIVTEQEPRFAAPKGASSGNGSSHPPKSNRTTSDTHLPHQRYQTPNQVSESITLDKKKYSKLSTGAQEIIASGKMGMPCRVKSSLKLQTMASNDSLPALTEPEQDHASGRREFEVDVAQMELDKLESNSTFEFPNARLVRSMRRCERKLLPLLDKWTAVDVVITKHEIVYVHVSDDDGSDNAEKVKEAGQQALKATKGGKGLRLCDVTAGRRVVGQLVFSDIVSVHVEREHCLPKAGIMSGVEAKQCYNHGHVEFWQEPGEDPRSWSLEEIQKRWETVNQDSLKIQTIHGTLYLRFYSDLEDSEENRVRVNEVDIGTPLHKDIALQWAQTILRRCNVEQLKQPLPHFGGNESDELRDLIQIVHREEKYKHRGKASGVHFRRFLTPTTLSYRPHRVSVDSGEFSGLPIFESNEDGNSPTEFSQHPLKSSSTPALSRTSTSNRIARFGSYHEDNSGSLIPKEDDDRRAMSIDL